MPEKILRGDLKTLSAWKNPNREEIISMIKENKSIEVIYQHLKAKGTPLSRPTLSKFRSRLNAGSYMAEKFNEIDRTLDVVRRHGELLVKLEESIQADMELEKTLPPEQRYTVARTINDRSKLITEMVVAHTKLKQDVGVIPSATKKVIEMRRTFEDQLAEVRQKIITSGKEKKKGDEENEQEIIIGAEN